MPPPLLPSPTLLCLPEDISILFTFAYRYLQGNELETISDGTFNNFGRLEKW